MHVVLNGRSEPLPDEPHTTLLTWLRRRGLTGSKEGCAEGECGACTVVLVRSQGEQSRYVAVNSCLVLLPMVAGQELYTVEGLARGGRLHEVQQAMVEHGGSQCGYCTPGFVMSLFAGRYAPHGLQLEHLHGNLCRCTGYRPIRDAALSLPPVSPEDPWAQRLRSPAPPLEPLHGQAFHRPTTLEEAFSLLEAGAHPVAGATDMAVELNLRNRRWEQLVSLEALTPLRTFRDSPEALELGAGLTLSEVEEHLHALPEVPRALLEWFPLFASPLIRNRATLGGNLATASPIGDSPPVLLALGAELKLLSRHGERRLPLADFFTGYRKTALQPGELIASVLLPKPFPRLSRFFKVAKRRADDISTVALGAALDVEQGRVTRVRLGLGGVAATPVRASAAEQALLGQPWGPQAVQRAQAALASTLQPLSDHRGSATYRLAMAQRLLEKLLAESQAEVPV